MFKKIVFPLMLVAVCVLACACFGGNQADTAPDANASPDPMASPNQSGAQTSPGQSGVQASPDAGSSATNSPQTQSGNAYDWTSGAGAVAGRINMISEIDSCYIVENEGTALVGVEFSSAYQGELTQRIRDMVAGEVMDSDRAVQVVAVTAEKDDVAKIKELSDQVSKGSAPQDLKQQIDMIARNTTTLR